MFWSILFIFGLVVGSFLNVVIHRLPVMIDDNKPGFNVARPASHCVHCLHVLRWHELVPVLSFAWQKGRCRQCDGRIAWQYPIVEVVCASFMLITYDVYGFNLLSFAIMALNALLLCLWVIDFKQQLLPDCLTLSGMWLGLLVSINHGFVSAASSILGAVSAYVFLRLIASGYQWLRKRDGIGGGDIKLMALIGAWFGSYNSLIILLVAVSAALVVSLALWAAKRIHWQQRVAFGPFLIIAVWFWLYVFY